MKYVKITEVVDGTTKTFKCNIKGIKRSATKTLFNLTTGEVIRHIDQISDGHHLLEL